MSLIVVDASCVAAWFLPSQATAAASALQHRLHQFDLIAPAILRTELRALFLKAERRGAAAAPDTVAALAAIELLGIQYAGDPGDDDLDLVLGTARGFNLTMYDAFYFQLAMIERAAIATRDGALLAAALGRGVPVEDCR